ncbi:MAG: hypothetical protein HRU14_17115, partial [Planctomycetes bacterium]|nr:hypothetical protein [Planctomycetota bacterium]
RKIFSGHSLATVQGFYTDGFYQRHFTPNELRDAFGAAGLETERVSITHMAKPMFPLLPAAIDRFLKERWGWLLAIEFRKPNASMESGA